MTESTGSQEASPSSLPSASYLTWWRVAQMHFTVANGGLEGIKETPLVAQGTGQALEYIPKFSTKSSLNKNGLSHKCGQFLWSYRQLAMAVTMC